MVVKVEGVGEVEVVDGVSAYAGDMSGTDAVDIEAAQMSPADQMALADQMAPHIKAIAQAARALSDLITATGKRHSQSA